MRKLFILLFIPIFMVCTKGNSSKEEKDSILQNLGLLSIRNNRLTVSGTAVKGIIKNATVTVNPLKKDGSCDTNTVLASEITNDSGSYSVPFNKTGGVVCLTISTNSNGRTTLYDEKAGMDVSVPSTSNFKLVTILPESKIANNNRKKTMVSPFSKMISKRLQYLVSQAGDGADINALHKKASKEIVIRFGLNSGLSVASSKGQISTRAATGISDADYPELDDIILELENPNSPMSGKFISVLVGFSQLANKYKKGGVVSVDDIDGMIDAFAADFEDGIFDGKTAGGKAITLGLGANAITFSGNPLTSLLLPAIVSYIQDGGKLTVGAPNTASSTITASQITSQTQFVDNATITSVTTTTPTTPTSPTSLPTISYSGSPFSFAQNVAITTVTPTITGTITSCASLPALPAGLTLSASCVISGTPTTFQVGANYSITATSSAGSATVVIIIGIGDLIASNLGASLAAYNTAAVNDLVKVTAAEYAAIQTNLSATIVGYNGTIDSNWATNVAINQTYAYQSTFVHANTVTVIPASSYVVAFSFIPALNPQNTFSCQPKYNNGNSLTNIANLYSGSTIAVQDRQYFVIKKPSIQIPATASSYLSLFTTSGIGTVSLVAHNYDYVAGNVIGAQTFTNGSALSTQYPTMQALSVTTKSW